MSLVNRVASKRETKEQIQRDRGERRLRDEISGLRSQNEQLHKQIDLLEKQLAFSRTIDSPTQRDRINSKLQKTPGKSTAIIVLTDWHAGQLVDPATISGLNQYDLDICRQRAEKVFQKSVMMVDWSRKLAAIDNIVVAILGDMISGGIHQELKETDLLSPTQSTNFALDILAQGIDLILRECRPKNLIVPCCYGNHGRTTAKKQIANSAELSYEFLMYQFLERLYAKDSRVHFQLTRGYHNYLDLHGRTVRFHHGDAIGFQGGVGGISIPVNKKIAQWNKARRADVDFFGHWHQYLDQYRWTSCPSLVGYDSFSNWIGADHQEPCQLFAVINGHHNKVLAEMIYSQ